MSRNHSASYYQQQQGSMLVISIFIIVVISMLAASLSRILSSTADSVANEVYSAKAYLAADSGMEYGIYRALDGVLTCNTYPVSAAVNTFDVTGESGLENCSVSVACQTIDLPGDSEQHYLVSTGTCDGGKIVAQHAVEAEIKL
ncbi:hypothetical protein [Moritella marina]|uniref:hypothetical protein n=1 Tax=Moritella marina TaxID=90736 RepID=UPI003704234B